MRVTSGINIFAGAMFLPVLILGILNVGAVQGVYVSSTFHTIFLILIFLIGVGAWGAALRGFMRTGSLRLLLIGSGLLAGAIVLLLHGLDFWSAVEGASGGIAHATAEWHKRVGMLLVGIFLFLTIGFVERTIALGVRRRWCAGFVLAALVAAGVGLWLGFAAPAMNIAVSASAGLWTPLGRFLQIASILLLTITAIRYLHGAFEIRSEAALAFATGTVLLVMAELTYAAVQVSYDSFFWMAHVWLLMGFLSLLWGATATNLAPHEEPLGNRAKKETVEKR